MKKYKYMVIHTHDEFAECLNDYGIDGWEDSEYLMPIGEPVWSYLLTTKHGTFYSVPHNTVKTHIDCLGNIPLFKALTAVRDDSDYMQYFVADCDLYFVDTKESYLKGELFLCKELDSKDLMISPSAKEPPFDHKATKEELIERFKRKNDEKMEIIFKAPGKEDSHE